MAGEKIHSLKYKTVLSPPSLRDPLYNCDVLVLIYSFDYIFF